MILIFIRRKREVVVIDSAREVSTIQFEREPKSRGWELWVALRAR